MANVCDYRVIVKGRKNACYAFYGSTACMGYKQIVSESGTDEQYEMLFFGNCKWSVDSYCAVFKGKTPVELPADFNAAYILGEDEYWYNTVQSRSKMFDVEVQCCSADIDDYDPEYGPEQLYEHYRSGVPCKDHMSGKIPENLVIKDPFEE